MPRGFGHSAQLVGSVHDAAIPPNFPRPSNRTSFRIGWDQRHFLICFHAWTSSWIARALGKCPGPIRQTMCALL
jgi:hypothetical protein